MLSKQSILWSLSETGGLKMRPNGVVMLKNTDL